MKDNKKAIIFQLEEDLKIASSQVLDSLGISMSAFLRNCLIQLVDNNADLVRHKNDKINNIVSSVS